MSLRYTLAMLGVLVASGAAIVRGFDVQLADRGASSAQAGAERAAIVDYGRTRSPVRVSIRFRRPPRAGLLFDLRSGRVLWSRRPARRAPIASLAKMMTALLVEESARPRERVFVTRNALRAPGSAVGVLPRGRHVRLETMLYGLMLPSGNDAARALAEHVAGTIPEFVRLMNRRARALALRCTRFSSPDGLRDEGNTSCAGDLAVLAREVLRRPRLARIVRTRYAVLPFPRRGGRLHLASHHPLLRAGYRGATGVKTGYTDAAGRCIVATARRGRHALGVVLLASRYPGDQAMRLLDRGFAALRARGARR